MHRSYLYKTWWILSYVLDWVYFIQCLSSFSSVDHLLHLYTQFLILFLVTYEVLSINKSVNLFFFGDFNVHLKEWLSNSGGTDRPGELCYNLISSDLTQMVHFPTRICDCDSHRPALLDFLSSDASICSAIVFSPLGNSD